MLFGLAALLLCQLIGEWISAWFHLPLPGPVLGMALLAILLAVRGHIPSGLSKASHGLLRYMPLFFIPAGVGVIGLSQILRTAWLPILVSLVGSTALALVTTALVMKGVQRLVQRRLARRSAS